MPILLRAGQSVWGAALTGLGVGLVVYGWIAFERWMIKGLTEEQVEEKQKRREKACKITIIAVVFGGGALWGILSLFR